MSILKELQEKQRKLDLFIYNKQNIPLSNLKLEEKIIALDVELSEFANEIEFFKFWKVNKGKDKILEEACDCLHFILSLANDKKFELKDYTIKAKPQKDNKILNDLYMSMKNQLWTMIFVHGKIESLNSIYRSLVQSLALIGYTTDDLVKEYNKKYEINIQRQNEGY